MHANKSKLYTAGSSELWKKTHTFKRVARSAFGFLKRTKPSMLALRASRAGAWSLLTNLPRLLQGERMNKERKGCSSEASQSADRSKPFPLHIGKKLEIVQNDRSLTVEENISRILGPPQLSSP